MFQNNYSEKNKYPYLKFLYKKYTEHIIDFENHIHRLYNDWIIDINHRNTILQNLDDLIKQLNKSYNTNIIQSKNENEDSLKIKIINKLNTLELIEKKISPDPFSSIKNKLIKIARKNGSKSMHHFLGLVIPGDYQILIDN